MMGIGTVLTIGGFTLAGATTSIILTNKGRNDLAALLDLLMRLALLGLFAYVLFSACITVLNMFGGFPRI